MQGIGKLKSVEIKLDIDAMVKPAVQPTRRIPFHIRKQVEQEINSLIKQDIIEKVPGNEATPWISQIVAVPKKENTAVRLCIDMRSANTTIRRVRHPVPTIDELIHDLNGSQYFSKLDLLSAYHQLSLHPDSRYASVSSKCQHPPPPPPPATPGVLQLLSARVLGLYHLNCPEVAWGSALLSIINKYQVVS